MSKAKQTIEKLTSQRRPTPFTRVRRLPKRGSYDAASLYAILDAATHCHIAHLIEGRPVATPTLHWRHADHVYWHGSAASRMLTTHAAGGEVCLTATLIDGFVLARSGFNHSINYRSVMCFGHPQEITDGTEKMQALEHFLEHWLPGRWARLRPPTKKEMAATRVLRMVIDEASAKVRSGGPHDPEGDLDWPVWAGVLPLGTFAGTPVPAEDYRHADAPPVLAGITPDNPRG